MNILGSTYLTTKNYLRPVHRSKKPLSQKTRLTYEFLAEWQVKRNIDAERLLKENLNYTASNVPFYRRYFAQHPDKNPEVLTDWPVLTRDHLWEDVASLQAMNPPNYETWTHASGGSTGKPVSVVHDDFFAAKAQALRKLCSRLFFDGPHYNQLILWGMTKEVDNNRSATSFKHKALDFARQMMGLKTSHINTFEFTQEKFEQCVNILRKQKPDFIFGYAGSVYELAKYLDEKGIRPPRPPRKVGTTAQTLHPFMRQKIEQVFGCKVIDHYGSREVGPIAWQHENGDMYFPRFFSHVEVVDEHGQPVAEGEQGRILVTTLHNKTMPLVRYDIGDTGVKGEDAVWRGYPFCVLKTISGRQSEEFTTVNGSRVCAPFFINLFYYRPWLDQFYIVQRDYDFVEVMYVPKADCAMTEAEVAEQIGEISGKIKTVMTDQCRVEWTPVDEVPTTKAGKRLFIRSEV